MLRSNSSSNLSYFQVRESVNYLHLSVSISAKRAQFLLNILLSYGQKNPVVADLRVPKASDRWSFLTIDFSLISKLSVK